MELTRQVVSLDLAKKLKELGVKEIPEYEGLYAITNVGQVYSILKKRWLKPWKGEYIFFVLTKDGKLKTHRAHRLVADTYLPNPRNWPYINHRDGDKHNNFVENLERCSASANQKHAFRTGLNSSAGERNSRAKLSVQDVHFIRFMQGNPGVTAKSLAQIHNINEQTVRDIWSGKRWKEAA